MGQYNEGTINSRRLSPTGKQNHVPAIVVTDDSFIEENQSLRRSSLVFSETEITPLNLSDRKQIQRPFSASAIVNTTRRQSLGLTITRHSFSTSVTSLPALNYDESKDNQNEPNNECTCDLRRSSESLNGQQMMPFFNLWSRKDNGKRLLGRVQREPAMTRSSIYRSCGCYTREYLKVSKSSVKTHCRCSSM